ncbi:MAG: zinc ribbon domain-containing protein, partial [Lachnospiraceae bacterium]|nr:zinc ribbon domain-containing protein [Lachnospiraceae bacterium]
MKICPKCNKRYDDNAAFCEECGTPLQAAPASAPVKAAKVCPSCGKQFAEGTFCDECGARLIDKPAAPKAEPAIIRCPSCGKIAQTGAAFCDNCGCRLPENFQAMTVEGAAKLENQLGKEVEQMMSKEPEIPEVKEAVSEAPGAVITGSAVSEATVRLDYVEEMIKKEAEEKPVLTCPNCHKVLPEGALFCDNCGTRIKVSEPVKAVEEAAEEAAAEVPEVPAEPEIPETPAEPEIPEVPAEPEVPEIPAEPEAPEIPAEPEIPEEEEPEVNNTFAPIGEFEENLSELAPEGGNSDIRICPKCYETLPADAVFCTNCGAKLEPIVKETVAEEIEQLEEKAVEQTEEVAEELNVAVDQTAEEAIEEIEEDMNDAAEEAKETIEEVVPEVPAAEPEKPEFKFCTNCG